MCGALVTVLRQEDGNEGEWNVPIYILESWSDLEVDRNGYLLLEYISRNIDQI